MDTALELLDEIGLDALSTRRLATALGVRPGALYWHVKNKQDLLDALAEKILGELAPVPPADAATWPDAVRRMAVDMRRVLLAHRDAARLVAGSAWLGPHRLGFADGLMRVLSVTGAPVAAVAHGCDTVVSYVTGFVLQEQSETGTTEDAESAQEPGEAPDFSGFPHLGAWAAEWNPGVRQEAFAAGLEILVTGLDRYLSHRPHA
ncbi:TetR/AcrR family transcriptional regulator C-terminal domain-containing protein [Streptomyces sp. NPDC057682]|uniref:TetR/AcrR family transcriptional regulator C-terminal domain-containing protein n=1 Tax=unclassified Streptomyces TaxID=2593676 RepID=UPI003650FFF5